MLDFGEKTLLTAWRLVPACTVLLFIALSIVPMHLPGLAHFMPMLPLIALFYWMMYKPTLLNYWGIFLIGIVQDSMQGTPLGVSSLLYLTLRLAMELIRRIFRRETFASIWIAFLLVSFMYSLIYWMLLCLYHGQWLNVLDMALQWIFTIFVYPAVHFLLNRAYYALPESVRHAQ